MKVIGSLIVIVLAALGFAWYSGNLTEQAMENYVATINEQPAYHAEMVSYEHGLFHSTANINIQPDLSMLFGDLDPLTQQQLFAMMGGIDQGFGFNMDIYHGPVIFNNGFYMGLFKSKITLDQSSPFLAAAIPSNVDVNEYFDLDMQMNYFGQGQFEMTVDSYSSTDANGSYNWGGLELISELENYGQSYEMQGTVHPLSFISPMFDLNTSSILMTANGVVGGLINDSDGKFSMASLNISAAGDDFSMNELEMGVDIDTSDDGTFSIDYEIGTGLIDSSEMEQPINNITFDFSVHDLSIEGFTKFYNASLETSSMTDPFQAQMLMMQSVADLFEGTPVFEIKELSFSQGSDIDFEMSTDMGFTENVFANPAVVQGNPFLAIKSLKSNVDMEFSAGFFTLALEAYINNQFNGLEMDPQLLEQMRQQQLAQVKTMTSGLIESGYLIFENDRYSLEAEMADGQLQVNGNPLPLPF